MTTSHSLPSLSFGRRQELAVLGAVVALTLGLAAADSALDELAGAAHAAPPAAASEFARPMPLAARAHEASASPATPVAAERLALLARIDQAVEVGELLALERRLVELDAQGQ
jgi:hypothetical protein